MNQTSRTLTLAGLAVIFAILTLAQGCQRVAPIRTLPSWVRGIYIPMVRNQTLEPNLEEVSTRQIQEAFLNDGRVDVVPKEQADLVLEVELKNWGAETVRTRGDYIGRTDRVSVVVSCKLYDPFDLKTPMADLGTFIVNSNFNIDTRSNSYEPEPDRKERLLKSMADQVMTRVINGFPTNMPALPPGTTVPQLRTPETIQMDEPLQPKPGADLSNPE